jgi:hypothetical protein
MMSIGDEATYLRHREARETQSRGAAALHEFGLPMLLFGSIGAIAWAVRGTDGWGGIDGTILPGLMWGLLWYYVCQRRGIDARGIPFWLGMGIALGGELGYGQYVSWMQGNFNVGEEVIAISPWIGYKWFVLCGIGWAAPGGILLGWALSKKASAFWWFVRSLFLLVLLALWHWRTIDWLGPRFLKLCPELLFPMADTGIYAGELGKHLGRTVYTNTQNFAFVMWWVAALVVAAVQRDKATLVAGLVIGGGFGIGFVLSALWCLGYVHAPGFIDWWKMWELQAGLNLGPLYVVTLYWAIRQVDKAHPKGKVTRTAAEPRPALIEWRDSVFLAAGGFLLVFVAGYEYFFWTGLFLAVFWVLAICLAACPFGRPDDSNNVTDRRRSIAIIYAAFLLVFMMFHGVTSRAGVLLGLYASEDVGQYAWPTARIALFAPVAVVLVAVAAFKMWQAIRPVADKPDAAERRLPARMAGVMVVMGFVGVVSIWPSMIWAFYVWFLCLTLIGFARLNRRLDAIDAGK